MILKLTFFERLLSRFHLLPTPVMDAFGGVLFGRALAIGLRRGFFEAVAARPRSIDGIARATGLSVNGAELLAESFVLAGYLSRSKDAYIVSSEGRKWLVKSSPWYLGNLVQYFETLYARWNYLEQSLERGSPAKPYFEMFDEEDWKVYVLGMRDLARLLLPEIRSRLDLGSNPRNLLDLGCSHGLFAIDCCLRYPTLRAVLMDFAGAVQHAQTGVDEAGLSSRVRVVASDFMKSDLPMDMDCVLLFNIIHGFTEEENLKLVGRAFHTLRPGGKLFILDQMKGDPVRSHLARFVPLMVGLNLLNEIGGNTYSYDQVRSWCSESSSVKRHRLRIPGVTLVEVVR